MAKTRDQSRKQTQARTPLYRLGVWAVRHRRAVLLIWGAAALLSVVLLPSLLGSLGLPTFGTQSSEAARAAEVLRTAFPLYGKEQMLLAFHSDNLIATDPRYQRAMRDAAIALSKQDGIVTVAWFPRAADPRSLGVPAKVGLMSFHGLPYKDPHNAYVVVGVNGDDRQLLDRFAGQRAAVEQAVQQAADGDVMAYFAGRTPLAFEMRTIELADSSRNEAIAVPLALIILLLGLGSLGSAFVPLITAGAGIVVTFGAFALLSHLMAFDTNLLIASSCAGFAVGIDYLLLIMSRYREELRTGASRDQAAGVAIATAGRTVVCSGLVVIVAMSGLHTIRTPFLEHFAIGVSAAIAMAVMAALTLGPAILAAWTPRLDMGALPRWKGDRPSDEGIWARWATHLLGRPWRYLLGSTILLLACAWPALDLRTGVDVMSQVPSETSTSHALRILERDGFSGGPATINVVVSRDRGQSPDAIVPLIAALQADPMVASVGQAHGTIVSAIAVIPRQKGDSSETINLLRRIRAEVVPQTAPAGHQVLVGGMPALLADDYDEVIGKFWLLACYVFATSFLLLLIIFRSLLVAIKAVITNALAVAAGIGVIVVGFQWGYGESLFGFRATESIVFYAPYMTFVLVYALSVDYEIFLLRRIQENYYATLDNDRSVATGLQRTALPILLAAAIMIVVFGGMIPSRSMGSKVVGVALVVAIIVDATLIRLVLVPASMKILGRWNWWLPRMAQPTPPHHPIRTGGAPVQPISDVDRVAAADRVRT